ncbi:MAG: hypothetical protein IJP80_00045 [Bacteroidales bacterium]|nr:hypothetical protein [Bacteroidales bacterium]
MKKTIIGIALFAVLGTLAVSCQKEKFIDRPLSTEESSSVYRVTYSIDGVTYHLTLVGDDTWHDFLHRMIALAEKGHRVSFRNEEASSGTATSKDIVTFTTSSHDDAHKWAIEMADKGYEVSIEFDERTGIYTCTAVK